MCCRIDGIDLLNSSMAWSISRSLTNSSLRALATEQSQSRSGVSEPKRALLDSPMSVFSFFQRLLNVQGQPVGSLSSGVEGTPRSRCTGPQERWGVMTSMSHPN
ncbi:hypothetical protein NEUTE2DRAFT_131935 [Neurospora tetrasperma FGSC 2509]|nr:hypothetical protein NEUTE2DRAFT_131935 [Neurospora tetrasperma FGSC 2509]